MTNQRIAELLSRKLSGEATPGEEEELQLLLKDNPDDQYFTDILLSYWNSHPDTTDADHNTADQHFAHILELAGEDTIPSENKRKTTVISLIKKLSIAAVSIGIIATAVWWFTQSSTTAVAAAQKNEIVAAKGARSSIELPDGSHVWLNSDSKLIYDAKFNDSIREVTLEGEAYFNVVKNAGRPFIVHTSGIDVQVLGTAFNVKSYPQERTIEATLIHGSIQVLNKKEPKSPKVILRPHEKLVFNKEQHAFAAGGQQEQEKAPAAKTSDMSISALPKNIPDTSLIETSWVYNKLLFDGDTFRELAVKMERWFNVKISFKDEKVANYRLRGVFENENIEEALQALKTIVSFNYKLTNNEIQISKK